VSRDLRRSGCSPLSSGILQASGRLPTALDAILASHAFIHTADGEHFREALSHASERSGCTVTRIAEREALARAAAALGTSPAQLEARVEAMGRPLGPPWTVDQKRATLVAWLLLASAAACSDGPKAARSGASPGRGPGPDTDERIR
jgi:hypothetical protein